MARPSAGAQRPDHSEAFTVVVRQPTPATRAADLEARVRDLLAAGTGSPGYVGAVVLHGGTAAEPALYVILRFTDRSAWSTWRHRAQVTDRLDDIAAEAGAAATHQQAQGIEGWFDLPGTTGRQPPPKWKMAAATWCTIFPLLLVANTVLSLVAGGLPRIVGLAIGTAITVPIMTWFAMPAVTRLLQPWLYPSEE